MRPLKGLKIGISTQTLSDKSAFKISSTQSGLTVTQYAGVAKPSSGNDVASSGQGGGQGRSLMAFGVLMATQHIIITIIIISYWGVNYSFLLVPRHNARWAQATSFPSRLVNELQVLEQIWWNKIKNQNHLPHHKMMATDWTFTSWIHLF